MIGKTPNDVNALLATARDGAGHTHVGDAPVSVPFHAIDEAELIRLINAIRAGSTAIIIVKAGSSQLRFMFANLRGGTLEALNMLRDVIWAKENG